MHHFMATSFSKRLLSTYVLGLWLCATAALADPVWHCTRSGVQVADASNNFNLASLDAEHEVIRISLRDLYSAYQGTTVKASGMVVSACFVGGNHVMTQTAMKSIGAVPQVLEKLSSQNAMVANHVYRVQNEHDMLACMTQHKPAIGYLSKATHTEDVGPCF